MGSVKPGYGPREPKKIGVSPEQAKSRYDAAKATPRGGPDYAGGARSARDRGLSVDAGTARRLVNDTLEAGRAARSGAKGEHAAQYQAAYHENLSKLQQVHPGLHQSVVAINHLESQVANGNKDPRVKKMLSEANHNINSRLTQGENKRLKSDTRVGSAQAANAKNRRPA